MHRRPATQKTAAIRFCLTLLFCSAACSAGVDNFSGLLLPGPAPALRIDYAGRPLLLYSIVTAGPCAIHGGSLQNETGPAIYASASGVCFVSQNGAWFSEERGLRLQLWAPDPDGAIVESLHRVFFESDGRSLAGFQRGPWRAGAFTDSELIALLGSPLALADGFVDAGLRDSAGFGDAALLLSAEAAPESFRFLARRFPPGEFAAVAFGEAIALLYRDAHSSQRWRTIIYHDRALSASLQEALGSVVEENRRLLSTAPNLIAEPGEFRFGAQDDGPLLEFNAGEDDGLYRIEAELDDGAHRIGEQRFLFAHSAVLFDRQRPDFRMSAALHAPLSGVSIRRDEAEALGCSSSRSCVSAPEADGGAGPFGPAWFALNDSLPGSPGIAATIAARLRPAWSPEEEDCTIDDLALSEWNPSGIYSEDQSMDAGGKFVELQYLRRCNPRGLALRFASEYLPLRGPPPSASIELLAASTRYFLNARQAQSQLRRLKSSDSLVLISFLHRQERQLSPGLSGQWTPGAAASSLGLRPVHSLTNCPCGLCVHGAIGQGLRPDLGASHGMSPGLQNPSPAGAQSCTALNFQLSEILPRGARDDDGQSLAGQEFVELRCAAELDPEADRPILRLSTLSGSGEHQQWNLPAPICHDGGRVVISGEAPRCTPAAEAWLELPALRLPDEGAFYHVVAGSLEDSTDLDGAAYGRLSSGSRRSSWARREEGPCTLGPWDVHAFGDAAGRCSQNTAASPLAPNRIDEATP